MSGRTSVLLGAGAAVLVVLAAAGGWLAGRAAVEAGPPEDSVDVGFLRDMVDHHEQAVRMALLVLGAEGASPAVWMSAVDVIGGQRYDLGLMDAWLDDWGHGRGPADRDDAMAWMGHEAMAPAEMPGMAGADELDALAGASGAAADVLYLDLMIAHHEGGVAMAEHAAAHAGDAKVRRLAELVAAGQQEEIGTLRLLRRQLAAEAP